MKRSDNFRNKIKVFIGWGEIFRILAVAIVLSLLMVAIPATPVLAASITIDPDEGEPGDLVTVDGQYFTPGLYVEIAFNWNVRAYKTVGANGTFTATITVPEVDADTHTIRVIDFDTGGPLADASFVVGGAGEIDIDPDEGPVGSEVEIDGEGFDDREDIAIEFDGDDLDIEDGPYRTDSDGEFKNTSIIIPESTAGDHTITVIGEDSDFEAEATFTVEPELIIEPASGPAGITVTLTGTGLGYKSDVRIFFDDDKVAEDKTDRNGSFTATFIVTESATGTYDIEAEDEDDNIATAEFTIAAAAAASFSINPASGNVATSVTATGNDFKANGTVTIKYDNVQVTTATADAEGTFSATFKVLPGTKGTHTITATDGTNTGSATFEILASASFKFEPTTGNVGTELTASGTGFIGEVTVKYDDKVIATTTADSSGAFSATFSAPVSTRGTHTITITDGTNTMTETFTMESKAPSAPELLAPEADAKTKATVEFDWKDVDDPSLPIIYALQVATDENFTKDSIVLEKTGLTESEYTITEAKKLEPVKKEASYYWRVKATDGASNEGDWSKPRSFFTGFTFTMPPWALNTLIGLGAVVLFLLGLWLGRRTAYY